MKSYRVTLQYDTNGRAGCISTVVPAYNDDQAISKVTDANSLKGQVITSKAVQTN